MSSRMMEPHPAAMLLPAMSEAEYGELKNDIQTNGLREPIWVYDNQVLDGRHRLRACVELDVEFETHEYTGGDPFGFVVSMNLHRRHLTAEQRRATAEALLKADPTRSDRAIARLAKVDHKTVAAARAEGEATGEIPQLKETKGTDGKIRPRVKRSSTPTTATTATKRSKEHGAKTAAASQKRVSVKDLVKEYRLRIAKDHNQLGNDERADFISRLRAILGTYASEPGKCAVAP
jgi:hypothetical protein